MNTEDFLGKRDKQQKKLKTPNDCNILEDNIVSARHGSLYIALILFSSFPLATHKQQQQQYILIIYTVRICTTTIYLAEKRKDEHPGKKIQLTHTHTVSYTLRDPLIYFAHFSVHKPTFTSYSENGKGKMNTTTEVDCCQAL